MPNWKEEASKFNIQRDFEANQKLILEEQTRLKEKTQIENLLSAESKRNYENIVLPGFKVLDSFHIKETLTEVNDQVWKNNEGVQQSDALAYNPRTGEEQIVAASYILTSPKILEYESAYTDPMMNDHSESISEKNSLLSVTYFNDGILCIHFFDKQSDINIKENNQEQIQNFIQTTLIEICASKQKLTYKNGYLITPVLMKYESLLHSKYPNINQPQKPTQKITFLDKLSGNK